MNRNQRPAEATGRKIGDGAWAAEVHAIHREAAGVVGVQVARQADAPRLFLRGIVGDTTSADLRTAVKEIRHRITLAEPLKPLLCVACPAPLFDMRAIGAISVVVPARSTPSRMLSLGVCRSCAVASDMNERVRGGLGCVWPDPRRIEVHAGAGHA